MISCDCKERVGIKIDSMKLFRELQVFFDKQVASGIFSDVKVSEPYYVGHDVDGTEMVWHADKWYKCNECGVLWEFTYPDFPARGFVRKLEDGKYRPKK